MEDKSNKPMSLSDRLRQELNQQQESQKPKEEVQLIKHQPSSYNQETGQLYSFIDSGINQTKQFFSTMVGGQYVGQHNFSFKHKSNIIKYVFQKNNVIAENISQQMKKQHNSKELYELLKLQNRMILVAQLADARNRIGINAYCWGALFGSLCMMINISIWKKGAIGFGIFHMFGSYVSHSNIDRVFDKIYPFYVSDLEDYKKEMENNTVGQLKQTKFDREQEDKRIKKYLKEISSKQE